MTQTLPTPSGEVTTPAWKCTRGACRQPATAVVHIDYPGNPFTGRAFRWSAMMCNACRKIEEIGSPINSARVSTSPLPVVSA